MDKLPQPPGNKTFTSRERVLSALLHQEADRLPIDLGGMASTGIMAVAYAQLKEHLGLSGGQIRVFDMEQQLAVVEPELLERFGVDVISLENTLGEDFPDLWKPWKLPNGIPCQIPSGVDLRPDDKNGGWLIWENGLPGHRMPDSSLYFTRIFHPLAGLTTPEELLAVPRPLVTDEELALLQMQAKNLFENTEFAIMANFGGNIHEAAQSLRGWAQFMLDLAVGGAFVEDLIEGIVETQLANLSLYLEAVGDYVQIIQFGDDLGTQDRPQMSREMYQQYLKPGHSRLYQHVHANSDCAVFLHSCGSIYPLIPDLIEAGVDILNPVQTSAKDMDPRNLKAEFGDQITFWGGGCDTQQVLPNASPEQIKKHVSEQAEIFAPGGGFVFNQIHNIQADVPPENIVAMFDAALAFQYNT